MTNPDGQFRADTETTATEEWLQEMGSYIALNLTPADFEDDPGYPEQTVQAALLPPIDPTLRARPGLPPRQPRPQVPALFSATGLPAITDTLTPHHR